MRWTFLIVLTCLGALVSVKCHPVSSSSDDNNNSKEEDDDGGDYETNQQLDYSNNDITPNSDSEFQLPKPPPPLQDTLDELDRLTASIVRSLNNTMMGIRNNSNNSPSHNESSSEQQDLTTSEANHHLEKMAYAGSNPFVNVLKALNLPTTFAEPRLSSDTSSSSTSSSAAPVQTSSSPAPLASPLSSFIDAITPAALSSSSASESTSSTSSLSSTTSSADESTTVPPSASSLSAASIFAAGIPLVNLNPNESPAPGLRYMTGNAMLDKIMNCPCPKEQLSAVGVRGVAYFNNPDPAIYRDPPYSMDALGPGDHIAANLKNVGGKTGNVFGQIIRLVIGLPTQALGVLKPLVTGIADTWAATTEAAAEVAGQKAKSIPTALRSGAVVIKKLLETFGDVTGTLLHVLANIIASLAAAKSSVAGTLPFAFDGIGDMIKGLASQVGAAVDLVSGTSEILSGGVINAAKTTGNLVVGLVEGAKGFKNGALEGIKYGINDEPQPGTGAGGQGWRR